MHIHTHTYIHACMHVYIHTYIHTYIICMHAYSTCNSVYILGVSAHRARMTLAFKMSMVIRARPGWDMTAKRSIAPRAHTKGATCMPSRLSAPCRASCARVRRPTSLSCQVRHVKNIWTERPAAPAVKAHASAPPASVTRHTLGLTAICSTHS